MAWGDDEHDQLGNAAVLEKGLEKWEEEVPPSDGAEAGTFSTRRSPVEELSGVKAIAAGIDPRSRAAGRRHRRRLGRRPRRRARQRRPGSEGAAPGRRHGPQRREPDRAGELDSAALLASGALRPGAPTRTGTSASARTETPSTRRRTSPRSGWSSGVSAGGSQMIAFGEALPTVTASRPSVGAAAGGTEVTITGTRPRGCERSALRRERRGGSFDAESPRRRSWPSPQPAAGPST